MPGVAHREQHVQTKSSQSRVPHDDVDRIGQEAATENRVGFLVSGADPVAERSLKS
jgi:hypothetical protein